MIGLRHVRTIQRGGNVIFGCKFSSWVRGKYREAYARNKRITYFVRDGGTVAPNACFPWPFSSKGRLWRLTNREQWSEPSTLSLELYRHNFLCFLSVTALSSLDLEKALTNVTRLALVWIFYTMPRRATLPLALHYLFHAFSCTLSMVRERETYSLACYTLVIFAL